MTAPDSPNTLPGDGGVGQGDAPIAISRSALRELQAISSFLTVRAARAVVRASELPWWRFIEREKALWVASSEAGAALAIERMDHHQEQAKWIGLTEVTEVVAPEGAAS